MKRSLSKLLEEIGGEIHEEGFVDAAGVIRPITKDEALARQIWRRALGYEENIVNIDKTVTHRVHSPDPKMQTFLIERREGKFVQPPDEKSISLLERIDGLIKQQLNTAAEQVVGDDRSEIQSDPE